MEKTKPDQQQRGRWKLLLVIFICASPLIFSYLTYYVIKPGGRTNYGTLIDPRAYPIPELGLRTQDGQPAALQAYKGKWIMLQTGASNCPDACMKQLYAMRQLRLMQGKEMERIERVWLIVDARLPDPGAMLGFAGMHLLHAAPAAVAAWLPVDAGASSSDYLYLIDPLGHLMMRFQKDADPSKVKKDLVKLLMASAIG